MLCQFLVYNKMIIYGNLWWLSSKESAYSAGDTGLIPGLGRSPGEGNGNPLQFLAQKIPWTEEPSGLQSMGSQELDTIQQLNHPPLYIYKESDREARNQLQEKKLQKTQTRVHAKQYATEQPVVSGDLHPLASGRGWVLVSATALKGPMLLALPLNLAGLLFIHSLSTSHCLLIWSLHNLRSSSQLCR